MINEASLYKPLEEYWHDVGYETYWEVPLITKRIDLICLYPHFDEVIATEIKVSNWKRAFQQALYYRLCADKVYVAISNVYINRIRNHLNMFSKYGIGILEIDGHVTEILPAKISAHIHESLIISVKNYIKRSKEEVNPIE